MPKTGQEVIGMVVEFGPVTGERDGGSWQVYKLATAETGFCEVAIDAKTIISEGEVKRRIWYNDTIGGEWRELSAFNNLPSNVMRQASGVLVNVRSLDEVRQANADRHETVRLRRAGFKVVNG